jgi:hypothetical protein
MFVALKLENALGFVMVEQSATEVRLFYFMTFK